jgi:protein-tyrosine phosphatase
MMGGDGVDRVGVLFVCTGNICRSPLAEGVFLHLARERGVAERFRVDSAGTGGWHEGERPDPRSVSVAAANGVALPGRARKLVPGRDWDSFEWLIAMDHGHAEAMVELGAPAGRVRLLRSFDEGLGRTHEALMGSGEGAVPDPYYGGDEGFVEVYKMVSAGCAGLLRALVGAGIRDR